MQDLICPNCNKAFKIDEAGYADIAKQVRNNEFDHELKNRLEFSDREKNSEIKLLESKFQAELQKTILSKDSEIGNLKSKIESFEDHKQLAINDAKNKIEKERDLLALEVDRLKQENLTQAQLDKYKFENEIQKAVTSKSEEITTLKAKIESIEISHQLSEKNIIEKHQVEIKEREESIERLKDMKSRLSTKMVGETLEKHCDTEFNKIRALAFPNAYFEKDNDISSGSKGDFIFRDEDDSGTEIVSIMFEMKNESDETATKKKNEDFLKELDKDRNEKKCEYAVLVSLLEPESELYNSGIVDVFHRYPKMYVIRPQFFIPMITLLRNAALGAMKYKSELALIKSQNIDITNFENKLESFKIAFGKNYELASRQFQNAINEIDKSITHLQKTKDSLMSADRSLRLANDKAQDVTIKKLTRGNQTMIEKFNDSENDN